MGIPEKIKNYYVNIKYKMHIRQCLGLIFLYSGTIQHIYFNIDLQGLPASHKIFSKPSMMEAKI